MPLPFFPWPLSESETSKQCSNWQLASNQPAGVCSLWGWLLLSSSAHFNRFDFSPLQFTLFKHGTGRIYVFRRFPMADGRDNGRCFWSTAPASRPVSCLVSVRPRLSICPATRQQTRYKSGCLANSSLSNVAASQSVGRRHYSNNHLQSVPQPNINTLLPDGAFFPFL